jgi:hypothetical protein
LFAASMFACSAAFAAARSEGVVTVTDIGGLPGGACRLDRDAVPQLPELAKRKAAREVRAAFRVTIGYTWP